MDTPQATIASRLFPAVRQGGQVHPRPTVALVDASGRILSHSPLSGHEPPFTVPIDAILNLDTTPPTAEPLH